MVCSAQSCSDSLDYHEFYQKLFDVSVLLVLVRDQAPEVDITGGCCDYLTFKAAAISFKG
jgi:hypothetical protein